jgi:hypothetical protein
MTDLERIMDKLYCMNCKHNNCWVEDTGEESVILKREADRETYRCKYCHYTWFRVKVGSPDYYIDPTERSYA